MWIIADMGKVVKLSWLMPLYVIAMLPLVSLITAPAHAAGAVATITEEDIEYGPEEQTVHVGQSIRLINNDPFDHKSRVSALRADGSPSTIVVHDHLDKPKGSYLFQLDAPGTYEIRCMLHDGMTATIKAVK